LAQPIEYKDLNWERIKIVKGADWTSIAIIKAVNPDKEIIEWWDNVKSESRLVKEKNWKYTLLSMERWSWTTPAGDIQFITETVNDIWNMAAEQMLSKIESRISDWNKINKELKEAKIQRMIDLAYQNDQRDADQMMYDIMDDESII
jgi:tRNA A22 N-methylase